MTTLRKETRRTTRRANARVVPVAAEARDWAAPKVDATLEWVAPKVDATREWAGPKVGSTRDWAAPKVGTAVEWVSPRVEPAVSKVKSDVLPKVAGAVAAAVAASEPVREEAKSRGTAAVAALRGEIEAPRRKRRRARTLFLLAGVIGAAVAGWKAWVGSTRDQPEPWTTPIGTPLSTSSAGTSSASTSPASTPWAPGDGPAAAAPVVMDPAGASPDEALADAADESASAAGSVTEEVEPEQASKIREMTDPA